MDAFDELFKAAERQRGGSGEAAGGASARLAEVTADASARNLEYEHGRVLETAKAQRLAGGSGSIILTPTSEKDMKDTMAASASLSAVMQQQSGKNGHAVVLMAMLPHARMLGMPSSAHACMPIAVLAGAVAQGAPLTTAAEKAVEGDLAGVDVDEGMQLRQDLLVGVASALPADAEALLAHVSEGGRAGVLELLDTLRRAEECLRADPVAAAAAACLGDGKGQLPAAYLDPAAAVAAVATRHRELAKITFLFLYGATPMEGGGLAAQLVAPQSTRDRLRTDQQQGAATMFGPGEAVTVFYGHGHASAVSLRGSTLRMQYLAEPDTAAAFSKCVVQLPDEMAEIAEIAVTAAPAAVASESDGGARPMTHRRGTASTPTASTPTTSTPTANTPTANMPTGNRQNADDDKDGNDRPPRRQPLPSEPVLSAADKRLIIMAIVRVIIPTLLVFIMVMRICDTATYGMNLFHSFTPQSMTNAMLGMWDHLRAVFNPVKQPQSMLDRLASTLASSLASAVSSSSLIVRDAAARVQRSWYRHEDAVASALDLMLDRMQLGSKSAPTSFDTLALHVIEGLLLGGGLDFWSADELCQYAPWIGGATAAAAAMATLGFARYLSKRYLSKR
ncbi:hypothetical protein HXX76_000888 [Chlamydomonas incerta]|uniref:Transmembrane protein n=1 Tax=Chlamydomonas incerta TaxID=51695 RepID=A0A836B344_CHLIN|nr:hypothetical protein HXX76_000888 [Chlamydomonas incerta]|eukprot:KAG2446300.1 hypothetical protein HXX76_000888 [Chlamydomonas incerta]